MTHRRTIAYAGSNFQQHLVGTRRRFVRRLAPIGAVAALTLTAATPALARTGGGYHAHHHFRDPVALVAVTPTPGNTAGAGGVFNIDLALLGWLGHTAGGPPSHLPAVARAHVVVGHWAKHGRRSTAEPLEPSALDLQLDATVGDYA